MAKVLGNHVTMTILLKLLLFNFCITSSQADECPHLCACEGDQNRQVNCSSKLLLNLPKTSASTLTLDLSHNALGPVFNATFVQMRDLTLIDLSQNGLTLLQDCTFSGMLGLKTVRLDGNRLTSLPDGLFTDANKVEHLSLSHNLFVVLPHDVFKNLPELKTLDLSHNQIVELKLGPRFQVLRHIQVIDLSHNHIEAIRKESFEIASAWEASTGRTINLAFCRISSIESGAISNIPNLYDLDLSGNNAVSMETLTSLVKELETGARNLDRLSLAHMNLSTITPLFIQVTELSLKFLNVSFNEINDIPASVFSTVRSLRVLDLSRNAIMTFAEGLSDLVNLRVLNISHNSIDSFHGDAVTQLSNLHSLDLSHNKLREANNVDFSPLTKLNHLIVNNNFLASVKLPSNASNLQFLDYHSNRVKEFSGLDDAAMLETVDLSDNDLKSVAGFLFRGAKFLKLANFSKNSIEKIDNRAFLPHSPLVIDLSHNFMKEIHYSNWVAAQKMNFKNNKIGEIDNQAFHGMTSLEELDLAENELLTFHEDIFHYLTNLKYLNLSNNGLKNLPWLHLFGNLEQLITLDLGHNNISILNESMLLPLSKIEILYLQANRLDTIIPRVFRDATELKVIDLSNNPLDCTCDMLAFKDWLSRTKISILGLYTLNSTAYHCQTPQNRAGIHVLHWNEEEFECNRSMLYLIIVCSGAVLFFLVGITGSVVYRFYKSRKIKAELKRKMKEEEEERMRQVKKAEIVKLSNQEIAEAIKDAIERKCRRNRRKYEMIERHNNYIPMSRQIGRSKEQDRSRRHHEHKEERKAITEKSRPKEKRSGREKHYEKMKVDERTKEEHAKQQRKDKENSSSRQPEQVVEQNKHNSKRDSDIKTSDGRQRNEDSSLNTHIYDRHVIPLKKLPHRYEDLKKEARLRGRESEVYYERDPRFRHALESSRRNGPYVISSTNTLPKKWENADAWNYSREEANRGYRRSRSQDYRMDDYMIIPVGDMGISRPGREARDHIHNRLPSDVRFMAEGQPVVSYTHPHIDDIHRGYYDHQRSQSYNFLPQDYTNRAPHFRRDRDQRQFKRLEQTRKDLRMGSRAVSQPFLATETTSDWL